jgi:hypothetical protein
MARLDPSISFTPTVRQALAGDRCIVVKDAQGGRPIRQWYAPWRAADGTTPGSSADLYDRLMEKVNAQADPGEADTVTFVWMQGERDAREGHGEVYAKSLAGLVEQLQADLGRQDVNVVIGRLSDFDMANERYQHWTVVRDAQVKLAEEHEHWTWVDTDDYNGPHDGLHHTPEGYRRLGAAFAHAAVALVRERLNDIPQESNE